MHESGIMSDEKKAKRSREQAEIEREILRDRKFSLADAVGRLGGGDLLKGDSPVPRKRQAEFEIERYLERNLIDGQGALRRVLLGRVRNSELFLRNGYDQPLETLAGVADQLLGSNLLLEAFVTEVDREWGRLYLERPHLEKPGEPPHPDDPYTFASVRQKLQDLVSRLRSS